MSNKMSELEADQVLKLVADETYGALKVNIVAGGGTGGSGATQTSVFQQLDGPVLDASQMTIPASSSLPLQVIASTTQITSKARIIETTGNFIGIYKGTSGAEVLIAVITPGMDAELNMIIAQGSRISLRNMSNAAITSGNVCIQLIG